jgi:1,4-alpha-glucan branching enzyme
MDQKFANLRALYGYMWAHPGKKLLFMGGELGQWREWTETASLDWHLLDERRHAGIQRLIRDLNRVYLRDGALWEVDNKPEGFSWIDVDNRNENVVAFLRKTGDHGRELICLGNFSAITKKKYRLGLPREGEYRPVINTDAEVYCGSGNVSVDTLVAEKSQVREFEYSVSIDLPPLSTLWFEAPRTDSTMGE